MGSKVPSPAVNPSLLHSGMEALLPPGIPEPRTIRVTEHQVIRSYPDGLLLELDQPIDNTIGEEQEWYCSNVVPFRSTYLINILPCSLHIYKSFLDMNILPTESQDLPSTHSCGGSQ